ncbi:MAG: hypothetical protein HKM96_04700 [Boseongicola sp.]|nr:hypothetical protein [Silicimonas sp.]NND43008.1 hypothetical protein [Silicimonas sp.]NNF90660.1 hypothetical protein [Boseongicola sp.]NNL35682.1 hypothetical protein [Silicimonas sp.]NNL73400.1 hypothetical protein [Silicimonas sp.]
MVVRIVFVILVATIIGTATVMSLGGVWGESNNVVSTRVGSPGGGYGLGGGVK